jgi:predicted Zn finger-like uncharacterized protein
MKVVCDTCQAKYQIPDERIAGRKLKIRCRKCGESILIHGEEIAAQSPTPGDSASTHAAPDEWHVSIDGEQYGPYALSQTIEMLRDGQVAWDAHVWREGYADWKTAGDSDTLVRAVASVVNPDAPTTAAPAPQAEDDGPTRMVQSSGIVDQAPQNAFRQSTEEYDAPVTSLPLFSANSARTAQGSATASAVSVQGSSSPGIAFQAPQRLPARKPRVTAEAALTGERHEDSVLFASRNLNASASPAIATAPSRAGYASGEGSGLIDIRALAALARSNSSHPAPAAQSAATKARPDARGDDGLMSLAHQSSAFANIDSLSPIAAPRRNNSNAVPIAIVAGSAMIAAAAFMAVYITRGQASTASVQPTAVSAVSQPVPSAAEPAPIAPIAAPVPAASAPATIQLPPAATAPKPTAVAARAPALAKASSSSKLSTGTKIAASASKAGASEGASGAKMASADGAEEHKADGKGISIDDLLVADKKPAAATETTKPAVASGPRSIDDLLDTAVTDKGKKPAAAPAPAAEDALPESPSRDAVMVALRSVEADVRKCAEGATLEEPAAKVAIVVSGSTGRVSSAKVTGIQGPVGSCIARAVRAASFPKFSKPQFNIEYPFKLK